MAHSSNMKVKKSSCVLFSIGFFICIGVAVFALTYESTVHTAPLKRTLNLSTNEINHLKAFAIKRHNEFLEKCSRIY